MPQSAAPLYISFARARSYMCTDFTMAFTSKTRRAPARPVSTPHADCFFSGQTCVVLLADSTRNYMTKFLDDKWMLSQPADKCLGAPSAGWACSSSAALIDCVPALPPEAADGPLQALALPQRAVEIDSHDDGGMRRRVCQSSIQPLDE